MEDATEEIVEDAPIAVAGIIAKGVRDEMTAKISDERLKGSGVGEYLGITNSGAMISVGKETNQIADTIVYNNIINMRSRCWGYRNAIWLANHDCLPELARLNQAVGTGGQLVWMPNAREDVPDVLLGRPLIFTEFAQTIGDQGDLILANFREYLEGIYQPLRADESIHVRFVNAERTFRFWLRNAGTPWWSSALTPKNSSITLSPFIQLDARA